MHLCRLEHKEDYYRTLCEWWYKWNFPIIAYTSIPDRIFVVSKEGVDLYAIPVYIGDSDLCWIGFITGNKDGAKELRKGALSLLINYVEIEMKKNGCRLIMTVSGTPILKKTFSDNNYLLSSEGINEYIKLL
jgi:hypothetical protein